MADVSILIVSYNTRELLTDCLTTLLAEPTPSTGAADSVEFDVIVLDNASNDGSADAIAAQFPQVKLIRSTSNLGWGRAINRASAHNGSPYLLFLNPDAKPVGHAVPELVRFAMAHPGHGLYSGRTLRPDGTDDNFSCWGLPTLWSLACYATGLSTVLRGQRWANPEGLPDYDRRSVREVPAVSGCMMLVERELFEQLGGFDPRYFLYSEDVDLSARARRLGARPLIYPGAAVTHVGGASSTSVGQRIKLLRGKSTYVRQHWSGWRQRLGVGLLAVGVALRATAQATAGLVRRTGPQPPEWVLVWRARSEWLPGWPECDEPRPRPADLPVASVTEAPDNPVASVSEAPHHPVASVTEANAASVRSA